MSFPPLLSSISNSKLTFSLLGAATVLLAGLTVWILLWRRLSPAERERQRRLDVFKHGRMGDAMITDVQEEALYYTYSIRGVDYAASQDISALRSSLPADLALLIGPATLKYAPQNPANSILLCEGWSGLRAHSIDGNGHDANAAEGVA